MSHPAGMPHAGRGEGLRITFVLPNPIRIPMGGAKVVYALGEALAARGHRVTVVAPRRTPGLRGRVMEAAVQVRDRLHGVPDRPYYAADGVRTLVLPTPDARHFPDGDITVATGYQTASWVAALPEEKGRGLYLVQSKEDYTSAGRAAVDTWHLPLVKVPVSTWLRDELEREGVASEPVVAPALDPSEFGLDEPIEGRAPHVLALYHRHPVKGPDVLVQVLRDVLERRPDARATVFSARPPSHRFPAGVRSIVRPNASELRALYNDASVFLHTSRREGLGLPPMEAAACGAAVVATANGGILSTFDEESARLRPVGDAPGLASDVLALWENSAARVRLATAARAVIDSRDWATAADTFIAICREYAR